MFLITVSFIALAWIGLGLWYAKERLVSPRGFEVGSAPYTYTQPRPQSVGLDNVRTSLAPPRSAYQARVRRQQVLVGLIALVVLTLLLTRLWWWMWVPQIVADAALVAFAVGLYQRSR